MSFANPALTLARAASDTFAGIRPADAPRFIVAQLAGAAIPAELAASVEALTGCVAGAARVEEMSAFLSAAGFESVNIEPRPDSQAIIGQCMPGAEEYLASARIEGRKAGGASCCAPSCCT